MSICSRIPNRYLVAIFSSVLLITSQSVSSSDSRPLSSVPICKPGCVTVIDYQSENTPLEFSRTVNVDESTANELPARWRHRYQIRLTRQGDDRIVFDQQGNRHWFRRNSDGTYGAADSTSGDLLFHEGQYLWTDTHAIQHRFYGSYPTSLKFPDDQILTLHYQRGQLQSVTDEQHGKIEFVHENDSLSGVLLPDGRTLRQSSDPCDPLAMPTIGAGAGESPTDEPVERCATEENPAPGFHAIQTRPGVTTLDARPASCQSYFVEFHGTTRGTEIEAGLEQHLPYAAMVPTNRSFPVIDFINGNELVIVRSRDLASPTYNQPGRPDALYERLMRDGAQIQTRALDPLAADGVLSGTENGRTTLITYGEQQSVALHLLIRQDMASAGHWQQIQAARSALAVRYGIRLQVIIIP